MGILKIIIEIGFNQNQPTPDGTVSNKFERQKKTILLPLNHFTEKKKSKQDFSQSIHKKTLFLGI